jgi:glycosyltransferase involved in cell wall biosynthesis
MCILIASSVHTWNDTRIFQREATSLAKKYNVDLYITSDFDFNLKNNVRIHGLPKWEKMSDRKIAIKKLFRIAIKNKFDIFHFHDPELIPLGIFVKLFRRKQVIFDIHEDVGKQILSKPYIKFKWIGKTISIIYNLIESVVIRLFDGVVVAGDDILPSYKPKTVLNNYPLINLIGSDFNLIKKNCFVYLGGVSSIRGVEEAANAIINLNREYKKEPLKLRIIGNFESKEYESYFLNKFGEIIEYFNWMDQSEAYKLVAECIAGIVLYTRVPNHYYLRSNKVFEYMAAGIPVLYSDFPDWKAKLDMYKVGFGVNPENEQQIVSRMKDLLQSDELVAGMGKNGKDAIQNKFNWEIEEKKLFELYDKLS